MPNANALEYTLSLIKTNYIYTQDNFSQLIENFKKANDLFKNFKNQALAFQSIFVQKDEKFFSLRVTDTYGKILLNFNPREILNYQENITVHEEGDGFVYQAQKSGYLIMEGDRLDIINPVEVSEDKLSMFFYILSVSYGQEALIDEYFMAMFNNKEDDRLAFRDEEIEVRNIIKNNKCEKREIKQGLAAIPTIHGQIDFEIELNKSQQIENKEKVDYKEKSPFLEIEQGTVIATRIKAKQGMPGRNVFDQEIPVQKKRDVEFRAGDNINLMEDEDKIIYKASITGILNLTKTSASISETLHIKTDVSNETGNLKYSRDIIIEGDVKSDFKIECGGDLFVKGNVEDGATIKCKGNATFTKGILGKNTFVMVEKDTQIKFMQDARIRILGNLTIADYVYNSFIYCKGILKVIGEHVKSKNRGAVIGGKINSLGAMILHSVGSTAVRTELISGIDLEAIKKLEELKTTTLALTQKITAMQKSIGVDLGDKNLSEKINKMPVSRRSMLKKYLLEIKQHIKRREEYSNNIEKVSKVTINKNTDEIYIDIENTLFPDVDIILSDSKLEMMERISNSRFYLKDEKHIQHISLTKINRSIVLEHEA